MTFKFICPGRTGLVFRHDPTQICIVPHLYDHATCPSVFARDGYFGV